ncbi:MAG: VOC family protein [Polyangiales bacterium]|nr:VOC family protein [Sandaracinaceae bacterium]
MEINGVAHIMLTVRSIPHSRPFYVALLDHMGLRRMVDSSEYLYYVGGRTAVGLRPASAAVLALEDDAPGARFDQGRVGLHHVCLRARSREDVDSVHDVLIALGATIVHPPREEPWAPGYYSVLFEDPDGIRLEVNHVPGKGLFEEGAKRGEP